MLAYAFLAVLAATERSDNPAPEGLIPLTCNEIHHLANVLIAPTDHQPGAQPALVDLAMTTSTPRQDLPLPAARNPSTMKISIYGCRTSPKAV